MAEANKTKVKKTTRSKASATRASLKVSDAEKNDDIVEVRKIEDILPQDYVPRFNKFGVHDGYLTMPSRIVNYILENPTNWYLNFDDYQYFGDEDFFLTLLFFIKTEGYINVKNIQTDEFYKITITHNGE